MWPYFAMSFVAAAIVWGGSVCERRFSGTRGTVLMVVSYVLAGLVFCFFAGARSLDVGIDVKIYGEPAFHRALEMGFADYFFGPYASWAPLSKILFWVAANVNQTFFWYFFVLQLVFVVPTFVAIRLLLKDSGYMGVFAFGVLFFPLSLCFMRQAIGMGFVLLAYVFVRRKKPLWFALFVIIGALFHDSTLFGLLIYPLYLIGAWDKGNMVIKCALATALTALVIFIIPPLFDLLIPYAGHYTSYVNRTYEAFQGPIKPGPIKIGAGTTLLFIILGVLYWLCLKRTDPKAPRSPELSGLAFTIFCGAISMFTGMITTPLSRLGLYLVMLGIVLIPMTVNRIDKMPTRAVYIGATIVILLGYSACYYILGYNINAVYPYVLA